MTPRKRRDPWRKQVLGVLKRFPKPCDKCEPGADCPECGARWSPIEKRRKKERDG